MQVGELPAIRLVYVIPSGSSLYCVMSGLDMSLLSSANDSVAMMRMATKLKLDFMLVTVRKSWRSQHKKV